MNVYYKIQAILAIPILLCLSQCGGEPEAEPHPVLDSAIVAGLPDNCLQVLLVTTNNWDSQTGKLERFERAKGRGNWQLVEGGDDGQRMIPVSVGRTGLAMGRGIVDYAEQRSWPVKKEGDGKAPAGIFEIGNLFGYALAFPDNPKMPYQQATEFDYYVDDSTSPDYNRWVRLERDQDPRARWQSFEYMRRTDELYKLGAVIRHNESPAVVPGAGSAIFLHLWRGPGKPTAGCTAMDEENLRVVLRWLDQAKYPLLIQFPEQAFAVEL